MTIEKDIQKLVIARLEMLPPDKRMSIGPSSGFSKDEIIEKVKSGDPIGKKIIEIEMEFLRALKEGIA